MTGKHLGAAHVISFLLILFLVMPVSPITASAGDEGLAKELIGSWYDDPEIAEDDEREISPTLTFSEDGTMSLLCCGKDGEYAFSYEGTWKFEYVPDLNDQVTFLFTATDNPAYAGKEYRVECVYEAYTESWDENDTLFTYLILTQVSSDGVTPFDDVYGDGWGVALHREQGPNMRVVKCKDYVSLRKKRSTASARLVRVPLGAPVLAFPEYGDENGFIFCLYHGQYGYILAEYLEPVE